MQVRRLVAHNVDFECLLESVPGWNKGVGTEVVRQHVRSSLPNLPIVLLYLYIQDFDRGQAEVPDVFRTRGLRKFGHLSGQYS